MSGTLDGADEELSAAFGMQSVAVAPHKPVIRVDHPDVECPDRSAQIAAIVDDTVGRHGRGQPVLIGTTSIGATREVSAALTAVGVAHRTLSAVNDAEEAAVIAEAGRLGAVTVATQMAGRGVDIVLGGAAGERERSRVRDLGGLMVWGLEHHRAARLDRQLAGRSGRQGDPGESRFATSPADELAVLDESGHSAGAAKRGQAVAERLDAELRADVRKIETVVDRLQDHLYAWREKAAAPAKAAEEIPAAVEALAREILESGNWPHGLAPRSLGLFRRRRQVRDHVMRSLDARRSDLGSDLFDRVASLVLKSLLAILWPDTLDQLGAKRSLLNLGAGFPGQLESWQATAVTTYDSFVRSVQAEWIRQVLGARVGDASLEPKPSDRAAWVPPAPSAVPPSDEPLLHEWEGWSFNRFVRQHFGSTVPDPPVVLAIDNVGDSPSAHGLRLHLDLEDARLTVVSLTSAPSGARDGADRGRGTAT